VQVKTKTLIVGALAVALVGMVWFRLVYSPMSSKTSKANQSAKSAQIDADNLQKALDGVTADKKKNATHDVESSKLLEAVPVDPAESLFLRNLDALRVTSGADWQSVTPAPPSAAGAVTSINVAITVQGSEDQVARYLNGLYLMKRVFVVDNVTLTPNGGSTPAGQTAVVPAGSLFIGGLMQMQVSGRIFSSPAAAPSPTGTTGTSGTATTPAKAPAAAATTPAGTQNS
jgi:Tfp pilus assembly protein PilO